MSGFVAAMWERSFRHAERGRGGGRGKPQNKELQCS